MGIISFFLKRFKFKPGWNGTPEMFLAMVMEMQSRNNKEYSAREVMQWGDVMQKVIKVNLSPYQDFPDLMKNGTPVSPWWKS
jgi:L-rhamnose mutarotase